MGTEESGFSLGSRKKYHDKYINKAVNFHGHFQISDKIKENFSKSHVPRNFIGNSSRKMSS